MVGHVLLAQFLEPEAACVGAEEFPGATTDAWTHYQHQNENKLGMAKRQFFPEARFGFSDELASRILALISRKK